MRTNQEKHSSELEQQREDLPPPTSAASRPAAGPDGAKRAQLVHSVYQLALEPSAYDSFMEHWDSHVQGALSALNDLKDKTALDDPELVAHFDRAFGILEELGRKPQEGPREGKNPRVLLDETGAVIWHNGAAAQAFELSSPADIDDLSPYFLDTDLRRRLLNELLSEALVDPEAFHLLRAQSQDESFFFLARPVQERGGQPAILLEPLLGEWSAEADALLSRAFGLTEAEIRVAAALAEGSTPSEIAVARGVSLSTVRSQIKTLVAKTGATGQTDLVRLLASLSSVVERRSKDETPSQTTTYLTPTRHRIPVERYGAPGGIPILFLHGMLDGCSSTSRIDRALKRHGLQVIAPARPSFGAATPHSGHVASIPQAFAKDIEWLLDQWKIREIRLLGHMAGGLHAFAIAAQLGERVERIVNVASGVPILSKNQFKSMSRRQQLVAYTARYAPAALPFVVRAGVRQLDSNGERAFMQALYESSPPDLEALGDPEIFASLQRGYRFTIAQGHKAFMTDAYHIVRDWSAFVEASTAPVTLIHGRHDPVVRSHTVEDFARRLGPRAKLQMLEEHGQLVLFGAPELVCRALL